MQKRLTVAAVMVAAVSALTSATAGAASAADTHPRPPITDVAGDARNPVGGKVPAADLHSADIVLHGRVLTATVRTGQSAAGGSGPANNYERAPYLLMGVFSNPNGQAVPVRITLNPGTRGILSISDEYSFEGATSSANGLTKVSFTVPRNAITYLSQGITVRTAAKGFAAFAQVGTVFGDASDRTDNYDFTLGG